MSYSISQKGLDLIKEYEGFVPHVYQNPGDVPTIGFGTTFYPDGRKVTLGDPDVTREQALEFVEHYVNTISLPTISKHVEVPLTQGNVDSICDFTYNLGNGAFIGSHLLIQINNKADQQTITNEFKKWIYVNHKPNDWQIKRRNADIQMYFS